MLDFEEYEFSEPRPTQPVVVVSPPGRKASAAEFRKYADDLEEWERKDTDFIKEIEAWRNRENVLSKRFRHDCLEDVGLLDHPKADRIWEFALLYAGDSLETTYDILTDLADFILQN